MEACGMDDLLSSFSSDTFAVQSQSEKDLRASLNSFFSVNQNHANKDERLFGFGPHTTLPTLPWSQPPGMTRDSSSGDTWNRDMQPPNTPMGTPVRGSGCMIPIDACHYNSPTLSHRALGDLSSVGQSVSASANCLACMYLLQNPSQFSTIMPTQHQDGCVHLRSPSENAIYGPPARDLHLDPSLVQQMTSAEETFYGHHA